MGDGFRSRRWRWGWRRVRSKRLRNTRSSESSLGKRSASFRRCNSNWRTWPRRWKRRGCLFIRRRGSPGKKGVPSPADMATQVEAARLLVYQAAWLADKKDVRFTRESSMAKLFASEIAVQVANECVQIHGGYGFIKDYPAEKYYRDVKLCTIGEGTSEIQRWVIARQLLGKTK